MSARGRGPLVVVGDALLDRDLDGPVERLAPDAPVPVVDSPTDTPRPGGAALAAHLAAADGVETVLVAPLGRDEASMALREVLHPDVRVVPLPLDGTLAQKIRVKAAGRTMVRLDRGDGVPGPPDPAAQEAIRGAGALLVSDYGRGTAALAQIRELVARRCAGAPLVWDPHGRGPAPVPGTLVATPNLREARAAARPGIKQDAHSGGAEASHFPDEAIETARGLLKTWDVAGVCITLGERGALYARSGDSPLIVPAPIVSGGDPCGAGDRFAAALATALGRGALPSEAVVAAVASAAHFVEAGGASAVRPARPAEEQGSGAMRNGDALASLHHPAALDERLRAVRARGGRIVATGGCFDVLHAGHLSCLRAARALGDFLVVCLNSDASVRRRKGPGRPVNPQDDRAALLAALDCVDAVAVFDEDDPRALLARLKPHVWVKGGDYSGAQLPETALVHSWGGHVVTVPYLAGRSSTALIRAVAGAADASAAPGH